MNYYTDRHYKDIHWENNKLLIGEYENCTFTKCTFSGAVLNGFSFSDCTFESCDLSLAAIQNTAFKGVHFKNCKILGVLFEKASDFAFRVSFEHCKMDNTSFYRKNLKKTVFNTCTLKDVDFTESLLSETVFKYCNLQGALFMQTVLEKTDFSSAENFRLALEHNIIKKPVFPRSGLAGLLSHFPIQITD